jgi:hypothetical protein
MVAYPAPHAHPERSTLVVRLRTHRRLRTFHEGSSDLQRRRRTTSGDALCCNKRRCCGAPGPRVQKLDGIRTMNCSHLCTAAIHQAAHPHAHQESYRDCGNLQGVAVFPSYVCSVKCLLGQSDKLYHYSLWSRGGNRLNTGFIASVKIWINILDSPSPSLTVRYSGAVAP